MNLFEKIKKTFHSAALICTDFTLEAESQEYDALHFLVNQIKIHYRKAKITPKKEGLFVTFWKRIPSGIIAPFDETDDFRFLIVAVEKENDSGYFLFPKSILVAQKIVSTPTKEGKRAFRIYPPSSNPQNKQAIASQKWQLNYYIPKNELTNKTFERILFESPKI